MIIIKNIKKLYYYYDDDDAMIVKSLLPYFDFFFNKLDIDVN